MTETTPLSLDIQENKADTCPEILKDRYSAILNKIEQSGLTQAELAKKFGVSAGAVSSFRANTYKGNYLTVIEAAERFFNIKVMGSVYQFGKLLTATKTRETLLNVLNSGLGLTNKKGEQNEGGPIIKIVGPPGAGKTSAINSFKKEYPKNVHIVTISPQANSYSAVVDDLCEQLGIPTSGSALKKGRAIRKQLLKLGSALIVLDECQHAKLALLESLRIELVDSGIGLILVGNPTIDDTISGVNIHILEQFKSRIVYSYVITANQLQKDIAKVLNDNQFFDDEVIVWCQKNVRDLRELNGIMNNALVLANGQPLALTDVKQAYQAKTSIN